MTGYDFKVRQATQKTNLQERALTAETANFRYKPLGKDEFRLLEIAPGEMDAPLVCTLKHTSYQSDEWYCALSYTWGSPEPPFFVRCDGSDIRITSSLYDALCKMRRKWRHVLVWADAICINQSDNSEKSVQVMRMGEIYSKASRLFIWLGNPVTASDSDIAIRALKKLGKSLKSGDPALKGILWTRAMSHEDGQEMWQERWQAEAMGKNEWLKLQDFLRMPWFSRAWVFQEVASVMAFSPANILVGYGNRVIDWVAVIKVMGVPDLFKALNPASVRSPAAFTMERQLYMVSRVHNVNFYVPQGRTNEEHVAEALARKFPADGRPLGAFELKGRSTTYIAIVIDLRRRGVPGSGHFDLSKPDSVRDAGLMTELVLNIFSKGSYRSIGVSLKLYGIIILTPAHPIFTTRCPSTLITYCYLQARYSKYPSMFSQNVLLVTSLLVNS